MPHLQIDKQPLNEIVLTDEQRKIVSKFQAHLDLTEGRYPSFEEAVDRIFKKVGKELHRDIKKTAQVMDQISIR